MHASHSELSLIHIFPDDHVGVSANISRISTLNLKDPDHYMASENVFDVAKKLGYWDATVFQCLLACEFVLEPVSSDFSTQNRSFTCV